jgi:hypothetical protein
VRPDGDATGLVDGLDRLGHGGRLAQAEGGPALDEVSADERADVVDALVRQTAGVGGGGQDGFGEVRTADGLAGGDAGVELVFVQLEAELLQRGGHAQGAVLAVGEELGELLGEHRAGVVDVVAEDVQFAGDWRVLVNGGDLDGGDDAHAETLAGGDGLGDAADGVVVG